MGDATRSINNDDTNTMNGSGKAQTQQNDVSRFGGNTTRLVNDKNNESDLSSDDPDLSRFGGGKTTMLFNSNRMK